MEKTVIIYDQLMESPVSFIVMKGDLRKFNGIYINRYTKKRAENDLQEELAKLLYDDDGEAKYKSTRQFPSHEVVAGAHVIVAGFIP